MEYRIVYLLTNPVMPGLVKIGMTTQEDIDPNDIMYLKDDNTIYFRPLDFNQGAL